MISRRAWLLGAGATLLGKVAVAQPRVVHVGYLTPSLPAEEGALHTEAVAESLRDQGYVEGLTPGLRAARRRGE